jgi:hypothetical protein
VFELLNNRLALWNLRSSLSAQPSEMETLRKRREREEKRGILGSRNGVLESLFLVLREPLGLVLSMIIFLFSLVSVMPKAGQVQRGAGTMASFVIAGHQVNQLVTLRRKWVCSSRVAGLAGSVGLASSWLVVVGGMTLLAYFT